MSFLPITGMPTQLPVVGIDIGGSKIAVGLVGADGKLAEGRIHTTEQGRACLDAGAFAVVVGIAITHPTSITRWFASALVR